MKDCVFCKIILGEIPCHKIWEGKNHVAFLNIFPNTEGFTIIATKKHYPSYAFENSDEVYLELMKATKKVAKILDKTFPDVARTGMIVEGFGVDHLHSKLSPMHNTKRANGWEPIESIKGKYYRSYPGFLTSRDAKREDDKKLERLAKKIRKVGESI